MASVFGWPDPNTWDVASARLRFVIFQPFSILATSRRVWIKLSKHGDH